MEIIIGKEGHHVVIKGSILQKDITVLNVYLSNNRASTIRKILIEIQGEVDEFTIIAGDSCCCCYCCVPKLCPTLCASRDCSTPGFPVLHYLQEFMSISNLRPLSWWCHLTISSSAASSCCLQSFPASGLLQWVGSSHQVAKILELQFQHQFFQRIFRVDFL